MGWLTAGIKTSHISPGLMSMLSISFKYGVFLPWTSLVKGDGPCGDDPVFLADRKTDKSSWIVNLSKVLGGKCPEFCQPSIWQTSSLVVVVCYTAQQHWGRHGC